MKNKLLLLAGLLVVDYVNANPGERAQDPSVIIVVIEEETPPSEISQEERSRLGVNLELFRKTIAVSQDSSFSDICDLEKKEGEINQRIFRFLSDCSQNNNCMNRMSEFSSLAREADENYSKIQKVVGDMLKKGHDFFTIRRAIHFMSTNNRN